jgi:hypothetical protein
MLCLAALGALSCGIAEAAPAKSPFTLKGTAAAVRTGDVALPKAIQMTSQNDPTQPYGVTGGNIIYSPPQPVLFSQLSEVSLDWKAVTPWGGGSPRISIAVDVNDDGVFNTANGDGWLFIFIVNGYPAFYGGPAAWQNTGNLIGNNSPALYDTNQIKVDLGNDGDYDGTTVDNYNHTLAMVANKRVFSVMLVTDGGWFTQSYYNVPQQVVWANNFTINSDRLHC